MKQNSLLKFILFGFICAALASSCVKEGPMGPAGADGIDGTDGTNGLNGTDGTVTCIVCHSSNQVIYAKENQYKVSGHANLPDFERSEGECATCHTSQGFRGNLDGSYDWTADGAFINNPNPQNCYTCHKIHETYTSDDLELTVVPDQEIALRNTSMTHDYGDANVCVTCHQARTLSPFPTVGGDSIAVTSPYWGLHHGPQGNIFGGVGMGLFEVGSGLYNHIHSNNIKDACVTCHMGKAYGTQAGGHTLKMTYEYHGHEVMNDAGCKTAGCHDASVNMMEKFEGFETEIKVLLADLKTSLDAAGITKPGSESPIPGKYTPIVAGAFIDYAAISQDGSFGTHNPSYVENLLKNLIAELGK